MAVIVTSGPKVGAAVGGEVTSLTKQSGMLIQQEEVSERAHSICLYGDSKSLKSWNALRCAEWVLRTTGKTARVIYSDLGGFRDMKNASEGGLVQLFNIAQAESVVAAAQKVARGMWPVETESGLELKPFNESGGEEVGCIIVDSLSSLAMLMMQELVSKGQRTGQDVVAAFEWHGEKFGSPAQSHYGTVQSMIRRFMASISAVKVDLVVFTALEGKGQDDAKRVTLGPMVIGQALTDVMGTMTGDMFHLERLEGENGKGDYRAWFRPHQHSLLPLMWPAGLRLDEGLDEWNTKHPDGYIKVGKESGGGSIADYLEFRAQMGRKQVDDYRAMVEQFKGKPQAQQVTSKKTTNK